MRFIQEEEGKHYFKLSMIISSCTTYKLQFFSIFDVAISSLKLKAKPLAGDFQLWTSFRGLNDDNQTDNRREWISKRISVTFKSVDYTTLHKSVKFTANVRPKVGWRRHVSRWTRWITRLEPPPPHSLGGLGRCQSQRNNVRLVGQVDLALSQQLDKR